MLTNITTGKMIARKIVHCNTYWTRLRGLMFRSSHAVADEQVYIFGEKRESVAQTTIHMFFVFFPIAVVWLDAEKRVVDKKLAKPFRPIYAPNGPAQYFVEGHPSLLERVTAGDQLDFT
jgi:uncharacterized membrane protein (UPF0127 family)